MMSASWLIGFLGAVGGCGGGLHGGQSTRPPDEFCAAIIAGELGRAADAAHGALVAAGADRDADASAALATWLRAQPCVTAVEVPAAVVDTYPSIRELAVTLAPDVAGVVRLCHADLRLAPGGRVGVHPGNWNSQDPDPRCTPVVDAP